MNVLKGIFKRYTKTLRDEISDLREKNNALESRIKNCETVLEGYSGVCENIRNLNAMLADYPNAMKNISNLNNMLKDYPDLLKNIANLNIMLEGYSGVCENIRNLNAMLVDYPNAIKNISNLNNMLKDYPDLLKNIANLNIMLEGYSGVCENIRNLNAMLADYPNAMKNISNLNNMLKDYPDLLKNIANLNAMLDGYPDIRINVRNLNNALSKLTDAYENLSFNITQIKRKNVSNCTFAPVKDSNTESNVENTGNDYSYIDYFDFENHFRGSEELIKTRQMQYLEYFKDKSNVLDIGCGRGEFLELMRNEGINAVGVELYSDYADLCNEKGLTAYSGDGIEFLKHMDRVDGIIACQVIEHLTVNQIIELIDTAYEKLEDNGVIILETPNPRSLSIYTNAFYIDPTHVKPVHPETMRYFFNKAGFKAKNIKVLYTECSKPDIIYPVLDGEEEFNESYKKVLDMLYGSEDYAIIAVK